MVWVTKLDVTDAYHRGTVKPSQVGRFVYIVPSVPGYKGCIICIDLVFPMGWADSPKFFYTFSETLTDVANALLNTDLPVPCTPHRASPIYISLWMTSYQRCNRVHIVNTESFMAHSVPLSGSSRLYWGS